MKIYTKNRDKEEMVLCRLDDNNPRYNYLREFEDLISTVDDILGSENKCSDLINKELKNKVYRLFMYI